MVRAGHDEGSPASSQAAAATAAIAASLALTGSPSLGSIAEYVGRLVADPTERRRMGDNARERVERDFSAERVAREFEALYTA